MGNPMGYIQFDTVRKLDKEVHLDWIFPRVALNKMPIDPLCFWPFGSH